MKNNKSDQTPNIHTMQKKIEDTQLDDLLLNVINSEFLLHHYSKDFFSDLYITGCRSTELLKPEKWKLYSNQVQLTTLKTESLRTFPMSVLSSNFLSSLVDGISPYNGLTYDQATLEFRKVIQLHPIYSGDRIADTYLFRYNRARLEYRQKSDLLHVMKYFGWYSGNIAAQYITTPLIYDPHRY